MRTNVLAYSILSILLFFCFPSIINGQATCATAVNLTPGTTCSSGTSMSTGDLKNANSATPAPTCGSGTAYSVWYKFTATSTSATVTINNFANGIQSAPYIPYLEIFTVGSCGSFTTSLCQQATSGGSGSASITATGLTVNTVYYLRVYTTTQKTSGNCGFDICVKSSPNDDPASATSLTPGTSCSTTAGTLLTSTITTGLPIGCESAGNHWDVWYKFTAANTISTITISSLGANFTNPEIQLYSGTPGSLTSLQCGTTTFTNSSLTIGTTYYVRVSNIGASAPSGTVTFNICITYPPLNDDCADAISLYSNATCTNTSATLASSTPSTGIPLGCAAAGTYYDVWFSFVAASTVNETITLSSLTGISSQRIQIYSGACGSLSSVACSSTSTLSVSGLSVGATYYVRVSNYNTVATSTGNFDICITHPAPVIPSIDYGKSYVNVSKNSGGGTINPGDTLEVRATLVIKSSGLDSLAFLDTLHLGGGVRLIPASIALRTNEGKVYKSFTDAVGDDAGYFYTSGTDTVIRINFGAGATATTRGNLTNTSKPSVFGSTCIIMATYRVVVYSGYGTTLSLGGGKITGSTNAASGVVNNYSFSSRNAVVYSSPGLCPNSVAPSNSIGGDFNGTFGSGASQNRGPSSNVLGYTFATFSTNAPGDYYYGIANNTSAGGTTFTTTTTWDKPDNSPTTHRVFNLWDITGDHTGASNSAKGNLPCDPTKPVSPTNPCGYMLVVNSAYKTDTAFQYTVSNLCPNSYYEISSWLKNICYKCGCDSNGVSATTAGYLPSGPNDSSGVQPNITFDINGVDYYTTGNIPYGGLFPSTQAGSDTNNTWVKRGFTYLTGAAQTSFTLTIRNNAPGGGGNDWAMDDIALATCLPNMQYSPSLNPFTCNNNTYDVRDTIRSYFSNYVNYKWQRSTDGGGTWSDIPLATGTATPVWNGSTYQYITSYSVPPSNTNVSDSGDKYRVVVATTSGNLADTDCQITDGVSQITLNVGDCPNPLGTYILTFNGKAINGQGNLNWSTNKENEPVRFEIEGSVDGINFIKVGSLTGLRSANETNYYNFADTLLPRKTFYRISLINTAGRRTYSRIIQLQNSSEFSVSNVTSYFQSGISLDVNVAQDSKVEFALLNSSGNLIKFMQAKANNGTNNFIIADLASLARGVYILQVRNNGKTVTVKTIKK
jgi:trimeric autotransporter adhesin